MRIGLQFTMPSNAHTHLGLSIFLTWTSLGSRGYITWEARNELKYVFGRNVFDVRWTVIFMLTIGNGSKKCHEELDESGELDSGDPVEYGQIMASIWSRKRSNQYCKVNVIGGCCGTDSRHLTAVAENIIKAQEQTSWLTKDKPAKISWHVVWHFYNVWSPFHFTSFFKSPAVPALSPHFSHFIRITMNQFKIS